MKLSREDVDLFYRLMWDLQFYVNQKLNIMPDVESLEEYAQLPMEDKIPVRDALWQHPEFIEQYVSENPHGLSEEEREIVHKWTRFVQGTFYIYRFLKKHAIFIWDDKVYGVLGLQTSFEEMFPGARLPIMARAVLLPFKGKIVYDGILHVYSVYFGRGIRSSLHEIYMTAKQNDRIITTLEPELQPSRPKKKKKIPPEWANQLRALSEVVEKFRGGTPVQSAAFSLLRASVRLAYRAASENADPDEIWTLEQQVRRALTRLQRALERMERE